MNSLNINQVLPILPLESVMQAESEIVNAAIFATLRYSRLKFYIQFLCNFSLFGERFIFVIVPFDQFVKVYLKRSFVSLVSLH